MTDATKTIKGPATQEFIDIDKIRDGIVIMKNGGFCYADPEIWNWNPSTAKAPSSAPTPILSIPSNGRCKF